MNFFSIIKLSILNLKRRKLRAFLTILGVSIAIGMLFFLVNTAESVKNQITTVTLNLSDASRIEATEKYPSFNQFAPTQATNSAQPKRIKDSDINKFKEIPHVKAAYPNFFIPPTIGITLLNSKRATSSAVNLEKILIEDREQLKINYGTREEYIKEGSFFASNNENAIIPQAKLANILKINAGDTLTVKIESLPDPEKNEAKKTLAEFEVLVKGVAKNQQAPKDIPPEHRDQLYTVVFASYSLMRKIYEIAPPDPSIPKEHQIKRGEYSSAIVFADDIKEVRNIEKNIKELGFEAISVFSALDQINIFFTVLQVILGFFSLIGISIALIGISNTMFMAVLERTKEIGILKALGASDKDINRMFIVESASFGLFGALVGIVIASFVGFTIAFLGNLIVQSKIQEFSAAAPPGFFDNYTVKYTIDPLILLGTILFSIFIATIAGLLPATRASRLDPVKALKYE